jgi:hypothetical protein
VPVRQWVISVPKRLRGMLADRPQRDPLVPHAAPARRCGRCRHARLGEQRVFSRCQCSDHAYRPRCAQLFSESRTPVAVLCPAPLRTRAALRDPRPRRPWNQSPLHAAQTQSRQLGRAWPRPQVHAAGGELVQASDERDVFQASPDDLPVIDIHSL